jgi:type II secretory pathway pseudopilin PulG
MTKDKTGEIDQRRTDAAFTLTEVVVAAVLMLLSLGLLISTFVSSRRSVAITQNYLTALKIASSEAEQLQTNLYANIGPTNVTLTNTLVECQLSRSVATNALNSYKDIQITVEWTAPASSRRQALTNYMTISNTN